MLSELFDPRGLDQKISDSLNEQILSELKGSRYPALTS